MSRALIEVVEAMECPDRLRPTLWQVAYRCDRRGLYYENPSKLAGRLGKKLRTIRGHFTEMEREGLIEEVGRHPRNRSLKVWRLRFGDQSMAETVSIMEPEFEPPETSQERRRRVAESCRATVEIRAENVESCRAFIDKPSKHEGPDAAGVSDAHNAPSAPPAPQAADPLLDFFRREWPGTGACSAAEWRRAVEAAGGDGQRILRGLRRALSNLRQRSKPLNMRWWLADRGWLTGEA